MKNKFNLFVFAIVFAFIGTMSLSSCNDSADKPATEEVEGKCEEGKCGEGKCGEGDAKTETTEEHKCEEGKCGEGKCGEGK